MSIKTIDIHQFIEQTGNVYEAVIVAAKRARQIHDELKIELNQQLETLKALNSNSEPEEDSDVAIVNPDQLRISLDFEKRKKPTELAIEEVAQKKIKYEYKKEEVSPFSKSTKE